MLTNPSLFRPWFCTRHLWWSVGAPFLRFKKRTHHSAARGPGMVQSGNSSFCNSLLTSRHRRSSRMTPWNCRPSSRASAETSAPLYAGTSLCFIFRMARCSCATNLRPTDPRRTSDPSSSTASPCFFHQGSQHTWNRGSQHSSRNPSKDSRWRYRSWHLHCCGGVSCISPKLPQQRFIRYLSKPVCVLFSRASWKLLSFANTI